MKKMTLGMSMCALTATLFAQTNNSDIRQDYLTVEDVKVIGSSSDEIQIKVIDEKITEVAGTDLETPIVDTKINIDARIKKELAGIDKILNAKHNIKKRSIHKHVHTKKRTHSKRISKLTSTRLKQILPKYYKKGKFVVKGCKITKRFYTQMTEYEAREIAFEGCSHNRYRDHLGFKTIGIGHLITKKDRRRGLNYVSTSRALKMFKNDRKKHAALLYKDFPWIKHQPRKIQEFLKSLAFNVGVGHAEKWIHSKRIKATGIHQFKRMLSRIKSGKYKSAAWGFSRSRYCRQVQKSRSRFYIHLLRTA